jgi:CRISPR system Cascade subunit CasE
MIYLSRLYLNPHSRQVRSELSNFYELHRTVMHAFTRDFVADARVLFRLEINPQNGIPVLLVQSPFEPDWGFLVGPSKNYLLTLAECPVGVDRNPAVKSFDLGLNAGQRLAFRLRANPTVKKTVHADGKEDRKTRLGLVREEDQLKWLDRKLEAAGASLVSARTSNDSRIKGERRQENEKQSLSFLSVQFDGILQVKDPAALIEAIHAGIGSGKGLGFGLLSLAPIHG